MAKVERTETVRKAWDAPAAWPCGSPQRGFSVHFVLRIPAKSTIGALLVPLFGQFRKGNSANFACTGFSEVGQAPRVSPCGQSYLSFVTWERTWRREQHTAPDAESPPPV